MRHVVTMISEIGRGGAERVAVDFATTLAARGLRSDIWLTRPPADRPDAEAEIERARDDGVDVFYLNRSGRQDTRAWGPLRSWLDRERPDLIHSHTHGTNIWAALFGPQAKIKTICHEHTWSFQGQPLRRLGDYYIGRRADRILTVSRADRERMISLEKISPAKLTFLPNGIVVPDSLGRSIRPQLSIDNSATVAVTLARLDQQKRIDRLVDAAALCRDENLHFLIAGDGPFHDDIQQQINRMGLSRRVHLLGRREDRYDLLASSNFFILSSDFEGTPLAALEAMFAGLPVIAPAVGGLADVVESGSEGLLTEADASDLAGAIKKLASNAPLSQQMGRAARKRVSDNFTLDKTVDRLEEIYQEVLSE